MPAGTSAAGYFFAGRLTAEFEPGWERRERVEGVAKAEAAAIEGHSRTDLGSACRSSPGSEA